jgi:hypothetical protein
VIFLFGFKEFPLHNQISVLTILLLYIFGELLGCGCFAIFNYFQARFLWSISLLGIKPQLQWNAGYRTITNPGYKINFDTAIRDTFSGQAAVC